MVKKWMVFLFAAFLFFGCDEIVNIIDPPELEPEQIIPLAVGNYWVHRNTYYDTLGNVSQIKLDTLILSKDTTVAGMKMFYTGRHWFYNSDSGFHINSHPAPERVLYYKYPCETGDFFAGMKVMNDDTTITIASGTYNCIKYYDTRFKITDYVEPGTGVVLTKWDEGVPGAGFASDIPEMELISYNINK